MSGTVHLIFPQNEYYIYHVSVHEKGKAFNNFNLQSALEPVHNCRVFLEENERAHLLRCAIWSSKTLNGPQWSLFHRMVSEQSKGWRQTLSFYNPPQEWSHVNIAIYRASRDQYCLAFGNCVKESVKKLTHWSAYYFTHLDGWYPQPEGTVQFNDTPKLKALPALEINPQNFQRLKDFASIYVWTGR